MDKTPENSDELARIRKIVGQLRGVEKMILRGCHCRDLAQQTRAIGSAVKALEASIIKNHLSGDLRRAAKSKSLTSFERKLSELVRLLGN